MNSSTLQILFFSGIPIGIFLLVVGIKMLRKFFSSQNTVMEIPLSDKTMDFEIIKQGRYAVWVKAPVFQKNHLDKVKLQLYNKDKQEYIKLWHIFVRPQSNNGSAGQLKYLFFRAEAGNYRAEIVEGSNICKTLIFIEKLMLILTLVYSRFKEADMNKCFFQVRENTPPLYGLRGTLTTVLGGVSILVGIVFSVIPLD